MTGFIRLAILLSIVSSIIPAATAPGQADPTFAGPITERDIDYFARLLQLSEEQVRAVEQMHATYQESYEEAISPHMAGFREAREQVYEQASEYLGTGLEELVEEAHSRREVLVRIRNERDAVFFREIEPMLTEKQRRLLPRVHNARVRHIYRPIPGELPEATFDIIDLVEEVVGDQLYVNDSGDDLDAETRARIHAVLLEIDPQIAEALRASAKSRRDVAELVYRYMDLGRTADKGRKSGELDSQAYQELKQAQARVEEKFGAIVAPSAKHLERVQRNALQRFIEVLPPHMADELQRRYLEKAYPEVYPDRASAEPLYEAALQLEDLAEEQAVAIETMRETYQRKHAQASEEMAECIRTRRLVGIEIEPDSGEIMMREWQRLPELGNERLELNTQQVKAITQFLTPDQIEHLPEVDFENKPRPWDRDWERERRRRERN